MRENASPAAEYTDTANWLRPVSHIAQTAPHSEPKTPRSSPFTAAERYPPSPRNSRPPPGDQSAAVSPDAVSTEPLPVSGTVYIRLPLREKTSTLSDVSRAKEFPKTV